MKKTILTLILALLTTITFSQIWVKAVSVTIGTKNDKSSKFTWGETKQITDELLIKVSGQEFTVYTEEIQFYQTLKPEYTNDDGTGSYWLAVDEERKRCTVYLYYKGGDSIVIEYDDVCIIYGIVY
jgi:hypothetical protein